MDGQNIVHIICTAEKQFFFSFSHVFFYYISFNLKKFHLYLFFVEVQPEYSILQLKF